MLRTLIAVGCFACPALSQTTATWINPAGGLISDPANWSTGAVPGPQDTAVFSQGETYTVTLSANQAVQTIRVTDGVLTFSLGSRELSGRLNTQGGTTRFVGGSVRGPMFLDGGTVITEAGVTHTIASAGSTLVVQGTAHYIVRGYLDGYPPSCFISITPAATVTVEQGGILSLGGGSNHGTLRVRGQLAHDGFGNMGFFDVDGGVILGHSGTSLDGTVWFHNGAKCVTNDLTGNIARGLVLIEGDGTEVGISQVQSGQTTVRGGGTIVGPAPELHVTGTGRLVMADGGVSQRRVYRTGFGVIRFEPGNTAQFESFAGYPNVRLECLLNGNRTPAFTAAPAYSVVGGNSFSTTLDGTLIVDGINTDGLTVGEHIPLITRTVGPIAGAFHTVVLPVLNQGRVASLVVNADEVAVDILGAPCYTDFNHDGDHSSDGDIEAFFACLAGSCCQTCGSADFNGDGDFGTDADIESFFRVLGGGSC